MAKRDRLGHLLEGLPPAADVAPAADGAPAADLAGPAGAAAGASGAPRTASSEAS
jgi:hypothetical protein